MSRKRRRRKGDPPVTLRKVSPKEARMIVALDRKTKKRFDPDDKGLVAWNVTKSGLRKHQREERVLGAPPLDPDENR